MAEDQDRSRDDLTEEASPYRIEEFRRKGMVAQSKELNGLIALVAAGVTIYAVAPTLGGQLAEFMREVFRTDLSAKANPNDTSLVGQHMIKALKIAAELALPICLAGFILAIGGSFAQIGSIFSTDPIQPDLSKIDPIKGFQRLFSMRAVIDGIRVIIKMVAVLGVAYVIAHSEILGSAKYLTSEPSTLFHAFGDSARTMFLSLCGVLTIFAVVDFVHQRWEHGKSLRMTKQEAKQEYKEREGDPQIKARIRSVQREMARKRMMAAVKKADVVVTNPTHIAVALQYDKEKMLAPRVVAKGADFVAQKIKMIAAESGVPMVENVPLARTLYKSVKVGHVIPKVLYQAVAEVLAYVYRLKNRGV